MHYMLNLCTCSECVRTEGNTLVEIMSIPELSASAAAPQLLRYEENIESIESVTYYLEWPLRLRNFIHNTMDATHPIIWIDRRGFDLALLDVLQKSPATWICSDVRCYYTLSTLAPYIKIESNKVTWLEAAVSHTIRIISALNCWGK